MAWIRSLLIVAAGVALASTGVAADAREIRLKPSSTWVVDYGEDSCRLARSFGEGDQSVTLILSQFAPSEFFRVMFAGKSIKPRREVPPVEVVLRFGPNEAESKVDGMPGTLGKHPLFIVGPAQRIAPLTDAEKKASDEALRQDVSFTPDPIGPQRERAAIWLEINDLMRFDLVLQTGPMDKPMEALRTCSWDTVQSWGLDVEQQKMLLRRPIAKRGPSSWFRSSDYPMDMLRRGQQSVVNFRMMVDEQGNATSCHIQASTRPKEFDDVVCRLAMKRAKFEPALDAQGRPIKSYYYQTVTFRIAP